jgi:hypothetical protein
MAGGIEVQGVEDQRVRPPSRFLSVVAAILAIAGVAVIIDRTLAPPDEAPGTSVLASPIAVESVTTGRLDEIVPGFSGRLAVAAASPGRGASEVITWHSSDTAPTRMELGPLTGLRFDAGGTWVAGLGPHREAGARSLWLGRTGGALFPLGVRIRGFAWHEGSAASLAYTALDGEGTGLYVVDLLVGGTRLVSRDLPATRLRRWGDWGYGMSIPGPAYRTAVVPDAGRARVLEVGGFPVGGLPDGRVVFSPISPPDPPAIRYPRPFALNPVSGGVTFPSWVGPDEYPWALEPASAGDLIAVHLTASPFAGRDAVVRVLDGVGRVLTEIEGAASPPAMAWDASGRFLVLAVQGEVRSELAIVDLDSGETTRLPPLVGARSVIQDLAVLDQ